MEKSLEHHRNAINSFSQAVVKRGNLETEIYEKLQIDLETKNEEFTSRKENLALKIDAIRKIFNNVESIHLGK